MRAAAFAVVLAVAVTPAVAQPPPLSVYAADPEVTQVEVSPDGTRLAYVRSAPEARQLVVARDTVPLYRAAMGDSRVSGIGWVGPDHVLIITTVATAAAAPHLPLQTFSQATVINVVSREIVRPLNRVEGVLAALNGAPQRAVIRGDPFVTVRGYNAVDQRFPVFAVPLNGGATRELDRGTFDTAGHVVGPDGALIAKAEFSARDRRWRLLARRGSGWTAVTTLQTDDPPRLGGLGRAEGAVVTYGGPAGEIDLFQVDLATGAFTPLGVDGRAATSAVVHPATLRLIGVDLDGDRPDYWFDDPLLQRRWNAVTRGFPNDFVSLGSISDDLQTATVYVNGPGRTGATPYLVNLAQGRAELIAEPRAQLRADQLGEVRTYAYAASDGFQLNGVLTLPRGQPGRGLPAVVLVHDGRGGFASPRFNGMAQALASRGYAVFEPNFRGSTTTSALAAAGNGQWGGRMQSDLSDGVARLAADGIVDPRRVCVAGAGYGGYAALAGSRCNRGSIVARRRSTRSATCRRC